MFIQTIFQIFIAFITSHGWMLKHAFTTIQINFFVLETYICYIKYAKSVNMLIYWFFGPVNTHIY